MSGHLNHCRRPSHSEFCILNSEFGGPRPGYTMAELMIVVIIMLMLVAAALPVAKKVMDDSHVREASRQLNAYLAMAKARAVQTGRPCGIYLQCGDGNSQLSPLGILDPQGTTPPPGWWPVRHITQMYLAEVPAPYSGSYLDSVATVSVGGGTYYFNPTDPNEYVVLQSLVTPGETFQVRFDYKGDWYSFLYDQTATPPNTFRLSPFEVKIPPVNRVLPYQIRRSPKKVGKPLAMPTGTCIDLTYSGVGPTARGYPHPLGDSRSLASMIVVFTPSGGVDALYFNGQMGTPPNNTLFFLVGKVDKAIEDPTTASFADIRDSNLADPTSLWVTVGRGNGQVTTSENTPDPTIVTNTSIPAGQKLMFYLRAARSVATAREQMKGR